MCDDLMPLPFTFRRNVFSSVMENDSLSVCSIEKMYIFKLKNLREYKLHKKNVMRFYKYFQQFVFLVGLNKLHSTIYSKFLINIFIPASNIENKYSSIRISIFR